MRLVQPFELPANHYGAILADPPWHFETWSSKGYGRHAIRHYDTMRVPEIAMLPVRDLACADAVLFLWISWPMLEASLAVIDMWGFHYKTCGFSWVKTHSTMAGGVWRGTGYWTRANSEVCLLATRGKPQRRNADVAQAILEPRRQHSRKPDTVHDRIERLVAGPYVELFARSRREGWDSWGLEREKFDARQPAGEVQART